MPCELHDSMEGPLIDLLLFSGNEPKDLDVHMFLKEALIMKDFNHSNVMQLIGLCFGIERLPLVVLPYMNKGDVLSYIRNVGNVCIPIHTGSHKQWIQASLQRVGCI